MLSEADTVVYLLRRAVRRKPFWDAYPPTHLFTITPRPRFVNGGSDSCEYGWFIWDRPGGADRSEVLGSLRRGHPGSAEFSVFLAIYDALVARFGAGADEQFTAVLNGITKARRQSKRQQYNAAS